MACIYICLWPDVFLSCIYYMTFLRREVLDTMRNSGHVYDRKQETIRIEILLQWEKSSCKSNDEISGCAENPFIQ